MGKKIEEQKVEKMKQPWYGKIFKQICLPNPHPSPLPRRGNVPELDDSFNFLLLGKGNITVQGNKKEEVETNECRPDRAEQWAKRQVCHPELVSGSCDKTSNTISHDKGYAQVAGCRNCATHVDNFGDIGAKCTAHVERAVHFGRENFGTKFSRFTRILSPKIRFINYYNDHAPVQDSMILKPSWIIGSSQPLCSAFVFLTKNSTSPGCSQGRRSVRLRSLQPCRNPQVQDDIPGAGQGNVPELGDSFNSLLQVEKVARSAG